MLGAGGVALVLPFALALGIAGTAALGGSQALGGLSQVFAGPAAPEAADGATAPPGLESARAVPAIPVRPSRVPARARGGPTAQQHSTTPAGPHRPTTAHRPSVPAAPGPAPSAPPPDSSPGAPPAHPPTAPPTAVHAAGQTVADDAKALPAPVGGPAGDAAQTVVDLIP